jgi:hypothetical protein
MLPACVDHARNPDFGAPHGLRPEKRSRVRT